MYGANPKNKAAVMIKILNNSYPDLLVTAYEMPIIIESITNVAANSPNFFGSIDGVFGKSGFDAKPPSAPSPGTGKPPGKFPSPGILIFFNLYFG
jgi:hypothetical protein